MLDVVYDGTALTTFEGGTVTQVEAVTANLRDGTDTLSYIGTSAAVTVDLTAGTASGFTAIASIENVVGGAGADTLTGHAGDNVLSGGLGNDTLTGGAGNDTFNYALAHGADAVQGGPGADTLNITGSAGHNVLDVVYDGTALTTFEGGTVTQVEAVTANLRDGTDTLSYVGTSAAVTVDLTAGTASGFTAITSIENVVGGAGADTLTGHAGNNVLSGGLGNDTLNGGAGNDTLNGGDGIDTLNGGAGNNVMNGGAGNDVFVFEPLSFDSTINGFDANPAGGGQDLLNIAALGITAATFATSVHITTEGTGTMIDFGNPAVAHFSLIGVNAAAINATDFILAP